VGKKLLDVAMDGPHGQLHLIVPATVDFRYWLVTTYRVVESSVGKKLLDVVIGESTWTTPSWARGLVARRHRCADKEFDQHHHHYGNINHNETIATSAQQLLARPTVHTPP